MTVNPISSGRVQSAIALASSKTGVDFDYLLGQAKIESGLNANARAGTSSASGLYQFVEQSWLAVVKKHGSEHGRGARGQRRRLQPLGAPRAARRGTPPFSPRALCPARTCATTCT